MDLYEGSARVSGGVAMPRAQVLAVRERLGQCLQRVNAGDAEAAEDPALPGDLRAAVSMFSPQDIAMFVQALLAAATKANLLQVADRPWRPPARLYRLLGALLGGLEGPRAIAAANTACGTLDKLVAAGVPGDRREQLLAGLLGCVGAAAPALYEWLADRLRELPVETVAERVSPSAVPWLTNRIPLLPPSVMQTVLGAALASCGRLGERDRLPMWLALAAPVHGPRRDLLQPLPDGGARLVPGVLIEDENLPVPMVVRQFERQVNLLLAANIAVAPGDDDKRAVLRTLGPHLSSRDLDLCLRVLGMKAPFLLGPLFAGRSAEEADRLGRCCAEWREQGLLRALIEGLGDAPADVYGGFVRHLSGSEPGGPLQLSDDAPEAARALVREHAARYTH
jgi:hypothetical protein